MEPKQQPVTIQKTAKRYKLQMLLGMFTLALGIALTVAGREPGGPNGEPAALSLTGIYIAAAGFVWWAAAKAAAWWNHS